MAATEPEVHDGTAAAIPPTERVTVEPAAVEKAEPVTVTELPISPVVGGVGTVVINTGSNVVVPVTVPTPATVAVAVTV